MKLPILLLFSMLCLSITKENFSLIGTWKNDAIQLEYQFYSNGKAQFTQSGFGVGMSCTLDSLNSPMWLDFTIQRGKNKIEIPGLMKVIHPDTIVIEQFSPSLSVHPTQFSEDGEAMNKRHRLYRVK